MLFTCTWITLLIVHIAGAAILVRRAQRWTEAVFAVIAMGALWVVLSLAAIRIFIAPQSVWNDARLAEVVSMLKHYPLYLEPDQGPIRSYKYGPFGALAYLPAGLLADTPTNQMLLGSLLSGLYFFLPALWVIRRAAPRAQRLSMIAAFVCFAAVVHNSYTLAAPSSWIHTDAPALGFAACAIALSLTPSNQRRSIVARIGMAIFAALAVWTKQTVSPILLVLPIWSFMVRGWRDALHDLFYITIALALISVACVDSFDSHAMRYYMLTEPSHQPWLLANQAVLKMAETLFQQAWPIALMLIGVIALRETESSSSLRSWLNDNGWMLCVILALVLAPCALFGWLKAGGASNNGALITYFLLLAAVSAMGRVEKIRLIAHWPDARLLTQAVMILLAAELATRAFFNDFRFDADLAQAYHPDQNGSELAYRYEELHPGDIYFPWNLEASLLASNKFYHFDYGVHDRIIAGDSPSATQLQAGLPAHMRAIAYPPQLVPSLDMLGLLSDYRTPLHVPGLNGFVIYGRSEQPVATTPKGHAAQASL